MKLAIRRRSCSGLFYYLTPAGGWSPLESKAESFPGFPSAERRLGRRDGEIFELGAKTGGFGKKERK